MSVYMYNMYSCMFTLHGYEPILYYYMLVSKPYPRMYTISCMVRFFQYDTFCRIGMTKLLIFNNRFIHFKINKSNNTYNIKIDRKE